MRISKSETSSKFEKESQNPPGSCFSSLHFDIVSDFEIQISNLSPLHFPMRVDQPHEAAAVAADILGHGPVRGRDVALGDDEVDAVTYRGDGGNLRAFFHAGPVDQHQVEAFLD